MDTREMISTYATHGGAWNHLERVLVQEGLSQRFAADFISRCRYRLCKDTARYALMAYDHWVKTGSEESARFVLRLMGL